MAGQRGCRRCDARHRGGPVLHLLGHHTYVCTRHQIWIGPPDQVDHPQPSLAALPEVVAAQHRHLRLLHRIGRAATFDAVLTSFLICAHRWNFTDVETVNASNAWHTWDRRADLLIPPGTEDESFSASRLFAATYPEAIAVAELVGSLLWRRLAASGPDDQAVFAAEIGRRLGQPDYKPVARKDPIAHWIEQDCWQPPSLPHADFRSLRTFGGATFRKPTKDSDAKRRISALWFSRHHRGGDAMLHHRLLTPVVLRDWATKLEMFSSALALTANTKARADRSLTIKEQTAWAFSEWVRPEPAPSPYLDTAAEPVRWPERDGPRRSPDTRPMLPHEHRDYNRAMINPLRPPTSPNSTWQQAPTEP